MKTLVLLLNLLSIQVDSGEGRGVSVYSGHGGGGRGTTDNRGAHARCHDLRDIIERNACLRESEEEGMTGGAWRLIGIAAVALTVAVWG